MFGFFKKKKDTDITVIEEAPDDITVIEDSEDIDDDSSQNQDGLENAVRTSSGFVATESARVSTQAAAKKFAKPATL